MLGPSHPGTNARCTAMMIRPPVKNPTEGDSTRPALQYVTDGQVLPCTWRGPSPPFGFPPWLTPRCLLVAADVHCARRMLPGTAPYRRPGPQFTAPVVMLQVHVHPSRACIAPRPPLACVVSSCHAGRSWPRDASVAAGAFPGPAQLRDSLVSRSAARSEPHRLCAGWWRGRLTGWQPCVLCGAPVQLGREEVRQPAVDRRPRHGCIPDRRGAAAGSKSAFGRASSRLAPSRFLGLATFFLGRATFTVAHFRLLWPSRSGLRTPTLRSSPRGRSTPSAARLTRSGRRAASTSPSSRTAAATRPVAAPSGLRPRAAPARRACSPASRSR
jgi:hypothetical protein